MKPSICKFSYISDFEQDKQKKTISKNFIIPLLQINKKPSKYTEKNSIDIRGATESKQWKNIFRVMG